jgi:hypothetical protein
MSIHRPVFLRVWEPISSSTAYSVQNFYHSTITDGGIAYQFVDFGVEGLVSTGNADANELTISMPALTGAVEMAGRGSGQFLASITVYSFSAATAPEAPPMGQTVFVQFTGMLIGWQLPRMAELVLTIGSPLSPIDAQFPAGRFSSGLIGIPCRL